MSNDQSSGVGQGDTERGKAGHADDKVPEVAVDLGGHALPTRSGSPSAPPGRLHTWHSSGQVWVQCGVECVPAILQDIANLIARSPR